MKVSIPTIKFQNYQKLTAFEPISNLEKLPQKIDERSFITKIYGTFSQEEFKQVKRIQNVFKNFSIPNLTSLRNLFLRKYLTLLNLAAPPVEVTETGSFYLEDQKIAKNKDQKGLKNFAISLFVINSLIRKDKIPQVFDSYYKTWFGKDLESQTMNLDNSLYIHPMDKINKLFGRFTQEDLEREDLEKKYSGIENNPEKILNKKFKILTKLAESVLQEKGDFLFTFTDKERDEIKKLAVEYDYLDTFQKNLNISTKNLERVICVPKFNEKIKAGEYLNGFGLVINNVNVNGKDGIIVFSEKNLIHSLKLFNMAYLKEAQQFLLALPEEIDISQISLMEYQAANLIKNEKKALLSEIYFAPRSTDSLKDQFFSNNFSNSDVKEILENNKQVFSIETFINHDTKNFSQAGKLLAIQLLKLLRENKISPILITARAFNGSTHSPVNLYLRAGFKPYSHSTEDISEKYYKNGNTFPYKEAVNMYLKDFSEIEDRLKKLEELYLGNT